MGRAQKTLLDGGPIFVKRLRESPELALRIKELMAEPIPCDGAVTAPPLATPDVIFAAGLEGVVYALDRNSGEKLWSFDTAKTFTTLLGRSTRGGGIAGTAGPLVANGRLFVGSGYGQAQRPGNALVAFVPK